MIHNTTTTNDGVTKMIPMIGMPQGLEWLVILAIVVLVFGAAKLPDLARSSGQALRIFKTETKGLRDDEKAESETTPADGRSRDERDGQRRPNRGDAGFRGPADKRGSRPSSGPRKGKPPRKDG